MRESDGLAGPLAKIIELCPPFSAAANRLDIDDARGIEGEDSFDALVINDSADYERFANSAASACDYRAGKYLHALFIALFYAATDVHSIAYFKVRYLFPQTFALNGVEHLGFGGRNSFFFLRHIVTCSNSYLVKPFDPFGYAQGRLRSG